MAWIQIDDGIREHDKIYNLADALGISNAYAVGLMVCFWTWAVTAAPDGDVTNFPPRAISKAAGWEKGGSKGAQKFYDDLLRIRFLEKKEDGRIVIRNWQQHAGLLIDYIEHQKENNRKRVQKFRERQKKKPTITPSKRNEEVTPDRQDCNVTETLCNGSTYTKTLTKTLGKDKLSVINTPSSSTVEGAAPKDGGAGPDFGVVCQEFEEKVNPMPSSKDGVTLGELIRDYPVKRILDAIAETARCQGRSASYVRSVLKNEDRERKERPPARGPDLTDPSRYKNFGK
ncbi:MAG: hypothetical protein LKJ21_03125 [Oscillospiraceae bacterium]|jgi:hypothetical protein|nr:hypothetical protein [Oscillospiraceae bacterium]MCI1990023.1 hypothetical protein [Oscillospiraceae bacterium]MCI2034805.1 hypothetical protein [Oscillospiraceae bacterium]